MLFDALIVGGGPAGATTALLLAKAGWSVAIIEKKNFPRPKVCGELLSATNLPLLQHIGISNFYHTHAGPEVRRVGLFAGNTVLESPMPQANQPQGVWGRALGREKLDSKILEMAVNAGVKLWQPWEVKSLQQNTHFTAIIGSDHQVQQISARLAIIAHGSWERGLASNHYPHKVSDLLAFKTHFRHCTLASDLMPLLVFPGGYGGLVHSDGGRVSLSCCVRRDILHDIRQIYPKKKAGEAMLQHIRKYCRGFNQIITSAEREGNWLSAGPIKPGIRHSYKDGIFFVGNIAGEAHPIVAEGISMALQSAGLLTQIIKQEAPWLKNKFNEAGQLYTQRWNAHFAKRIYAAALFAHLAMRPWMSSLLLPCFKHFPRLLTLGATLSGKTTMYD
jgi:menaquinone-9 beta-reductase